MKIYSVKEVRDITGLTWKQLYEYRTGIPGIGSMNDAGYKQYSKEDLEKLVEAALMAKLGAKPKDINKVFSDERYDRKKVLKELQDRAKRQLIEAQDIITVAETLELLSNENTGLINPFAIRDLHIWAEKIRAARKDEDIVAFANYNERKGDDELFAEIGKLKDLEEIDIETEKSYSLVHRLKKFGEETIGIDGNRFLMILGSDLLASDYVRKKVENDFGEGKADIIWKSIIAYMYMEFSKESRDEIIRVVEYIVEGYDYDNEDVKTCIGDLKRSFMKNFGIKTTYEFLINFEHSKYVNRVTADSTDEEIKEWDEVIDYIIGAVRHYEEQPAS